MRGESGCAGQGAVAQIPLAGFVWASNGLCVLVLSHSAFGHHKSRVEQLRPWKVGQIAREEYKRIVCGPGRTGWGLPKGPGTK